MNDRNFRAIENDRIEIQWILNIFQWSYDHINVFLDAESESELKIDLSPILSELLIVHFSTATTSIRQRIHASSEILFLLWR